MMDDKDKYVIPAEAVSVEEFHIFCAHWGLELKQKWEPDSQNPTYIETWSLPKSIFECSFVDDKIVGFSYLILHNPDSEGVIADFKLSYGSVSQKEILEKVHGEHDHNTHLFLISLMSIAFESYDESAFSALKKYAVEPESPLLRRAAIEALARRVWPQSKQLLVSISNTDPDQDVRQQATRVLSRWPTQ